MVLFNSIVSTLTLNPNPEFGTAIYSYIYLQFLHSFTILLQNMATRKKSALYLLGEPTTILQSIRLASNGEALGMFCHHHLSLGLTTRQASACVIEEVTRVWNMARIPTCRKDHAITKLEQLYKDWSTLKKHKTRKSERHTANENEFCSKMNDLFDIAHANAASMIKIAEDMQFLEAQREPGRRGYLGSVDTALAAKEERKRKRIELENARRARAKEEMSQISDNTVPVVLEDDSSGDEACRLGEPDNTLADSISTAPKRRMRATKKILTPQLAAVLDRTKMSDRKATFIIAETARSLGHDISDLNINRSSIKRERERYRAEMAVALKKDLSGNVPLVVHWDGKLMENLSGKEHVDRLPIIVTGFGVCQLLKVSKMVGGTGKNQASAVVQALDEWNVQERVVGMCFDTTSSNTGVHNGACVEIERHLGKDLLHLACRHHIMELLAGAAFSACHVASSGPEVLLFKRFQQSWPYIDQTQYETGAKLDEILDSVKQDILEFAQNQLLQESVRDDYREFIELSIVFLGGAPARGIKFMAPGAMHHARWMSKVIYSLKVWMFRSQFKLTTSEEKGLRKMCVFAVVIYLKAWFTAPLAASAPRNDLQLLQDLYNYRQYDDKIAIATCKKLENHLWYLSEHLVALAFFDPNVSAETKRKMLNALQAEESVPHGPKRITLRADKAQQHNLDDFVTPNTHHLLTSLHIGCDFLQFDPETWIDRDDYTQGIATVNKLLVTNDNAERGVALVQELNKLITHDEEQFQFLLQVISDHRRRYPDCLKSTLMESTADS